MTKTTKATKTTAKKFLSILLVILMVLTAFPLIGFAEDYLTDPDTGLRYYISGNYAKISYQPSDLSGDIVVPDSIDGYPVTAIDYFAFHMNDNITSITIPATVSTIYGSSIAGNKELREIIVDPSNPYFTTDENGILFNKAKTKLITCPAANGLVDYEVPDSVRTLESHAFGYHKTLENVVLPEGLTRIESYLFNNCKNLKTVNIPYGVTVIGNAAFMGCESLESIVLPETVTSTGGCVFSDCKNLREVNIPTSLRQLSNGDLGNCRSLERLVLHKDFERFADTTVISGCTGLKEIIVEEGNRFFCTDEAGTLFNIDKTEIVFIPTGYEKHTFYLPATITEFDSTIFIGNTMITGIEVEEGNPNYVSDEYGALYNADKTELLYYPAGSENTEYIMPDTVTTMQYSAFFQATNLNSIKLSEALTEIPDTAFAFCTGLESIEIPANVTTIGAAAFGAAMNLKNVVLPEGLEYIYPGAFAACFSLENIIIPESVVYIGGDAFYMGDFSSLKTVFFAGSEEAWNNIVIEDQSTDVEEIYKEYLGEPATPFSTFPETAHIHLNCTNHDDAARVLIEDKSTKATCTEDGIEYYVCAFCPYEYDAYEVEKKEHVMGAWEVIADPTCYSVGLKIRKCENEGCDYVEKIVEAETHDYDLFEVVPATCTEKGYTVYKCVLCGDTYNDKFVGAKGHRTTEKVNVKIADCTNKGYTGDIVCTDCGAVLTYGSELKAIGHNDSDNDHYCNACNEIISEHEWVSVYERYPSCLENGEFISVCSVCGETKHEIIDAIGHVYISLFAERPATCSDPTERECVLCGHIEAIEGERVPHTFDEGVVVDPTCTSSGFTAYTCTECGTVEIADKIPALGHIDHDDDGVCDECLMNTTANADARTADGSYRCSFCDTYEANMNSPLGFIYKIIHFFMHNIFKTGRTA